MACLRSSTLHHDGCDCWTRADSPVTCGAAIDVPDTPSAPLPVPTDVDRMLTPGADTSGLRKLSSKRGPPDVKLARPLKPGFAFVAAIVVVPPSSATTSLPSLAGLVSGPRTPRNGMVTPAI